MPNFHSLARLGLRIIISYRSLIGHLHDGVILLLGQNPSGYCFLVQIIKTALGLANLNMKNEMNSGLGSKNTPSCSTVKGRSHFISRLSMIVRVNVVPNRTVVDSD